MAKGIVWPSLLQERYKVWFNSNAHTEASSSLPPCLGLFSHKSEDLRHIYHVHLMSSSLQLSNTLPTALWGRQLPMYAPVLFYILHILGY